MTEPLPPGSWPPPWWLVVEESPRWAPALRAELRRTGRDDAARQVAAEKSLPPLPSLMAARRPVVFVLEVDPTSGVAGPFSRLRGLGTLCGVACLRPGDNNTRQTAGDAWLLAAGAAAVLTTTLQVGRLVRLSDRHNADAWRRWEAGLPAADLVQRRLPWQPAPWAIG